MKQNKSKPQMDLTRPLSWSAINLFSDPEWGSPEKWYQSYVLGIRQSSPELIFGSMVDKKIQNDSSFIPSLPRYPLMQHKMNVMFGDIPLVGLPDGLCLDDFLLADYKTGNDKYPWTKKKADETGQLTMYLFLIYIAHKLSPEKFKLFIHWLPTKKEETGDFKTLISFRDDPVVPITFQTKRTMADILKFGGRIQKVWKEMQEYAANHE